MKEENTFLNDVVVIITTRNRISELLITIKKCLEIGLRQQQLFITDDASTDDTSQTVKHYFPEVRVQVNSNQKGLIHNRNFMMKNSSERFLLSLDDDSNLLSRSDLEEALQLLDSKKQYGIFGFMPVEQLATVNKSDFSNGEVFLSKWYIGCGHIIKRSTLDKIGLYREEFIFYGEEIDFSVRCFKAGLFVISKSDLIVHHRVNYKDRNNNIKGDKSKGEYGILWRSELAMANSLTHILINFPSLVIPYYFSKSLFSFFFNYVIKKKWLSCYRDALSRVWERQNYIKQERSPLTLKQFREYMRLEE